MSGAAGPALQAVVVRLRAAVAALRDVELQAVVDAGTSVVLTAGSAVLLGWCIPSTFIFKRRYLQFMSKSRSVGRVERALPWLLLVLLYVAVREWRRLRSLASETHGTHDSRGALWARRRR